MALPTSALSTRRPPLPAVAGPIGTGPSDLDETRERISAFAARMAAEAPFVAGFPANLRFDFSSAVFAPLMSVFANNVGDPDGRESSDVSAKAFERDIVRFFAELTHGDPAETFGYVTTGGSEGILHGLVTGRNVLPEAPVYVSSDTHYSVRKAAELLRMAVVEVPVDDSGRMPPARLRAAIAGDGGGAVVVANIGTTMTGAVDDVPALREAASGAGGVYVHADGALGGLVAPFVPEPLAWDFAAGADSISISGHKMLGMPFPCGIVLARASMVRDWRAGEYIGTRDRTLGCSRSGLASVLMWAALRDLGREGLGQRARSCLDVAEYARKTFSAAGLYAWRAENSVIVTFVLPGRDDAWQAVCRRWHLPTERRDGRVRSHLVAVPHITTATVDALCDDLSLLMVRG